MVSPPTSTSRAAPLSALRTMIVSGRSTKNWPDGNQSLRIVNRARDHIDSSLLAGRIHRQHSAGLKPYIGVNRVGESLYRRTKSPGLDN